MSHSNERLLKPPRKASLYKKNFGFVRNRTHRYNAAYHLQFVEYCWQINRRLTRTTRSLMNRTIIMELAGLVEVVLHDVLSSLHVHGPGVEDRPLPVADYLTLEKLIEWADYYGLVEGPLTDRLRNLNAARNSIHFKRFHKQRVLEHGYYTHEMVQEAVQTFEVFLSGIAGKLLRIPKSKKDFIYPWTPSVEKNGFLACREPS